MDDLDIEAIEAGIVVWEPDELRRECRALLAEVLRLTWERDRWREYCEGARESVATLTRERDAARNALAAVRAVVGSGS